MKTLTILICLTAVAVLAADTNSPAVRRALRQAQRTNAVPRIAGTNSVILTNRHAPPNTNFISPGRQRMLERQRMRGTNAPTIRTNSPAK